MIPDKILIIDTETGGIGVDAAEKWSIIQLGAVVWERTQTVWPPHDFNVVIREKGGLYAQPEALKVNGFTWERINQEGETPATAVGLFLIWLAKAFPDLHKGERIMLGGHNIGYDVSFLARLFKQADCLSLYDKVFSYRALDTASIARFLMLVGVVPNTRSESGSLLEDFGCKPEKPHDALSDALATAKMLTHMCNIFDSSRLDSGLFGYHKSFSSGIDEKNRRY